jgi:CubicO group peptidase (beta-lactamase class C family)
MTTMTATLSAPSCRTGLWLESSGRRLRHRIPFGPLGLFMGLTLGAAELPAQELALPAETVGESLLVRADDPHGEKAWAEHGFSAMQRDELRGAFRWGIDKAFIPGGALLICHEGDVIFREAFGVADLETGRPFTVETPCRIASVTKPHTATLLAILVGEGRLSWDDPVDRYLPAFRNLQVRGKGPAARPPLIRELLSHTAGFPSNDERRAGPPGFAPDGTLAGAVDEIAGSELASEPGSRFAYTGLGYMVAGRVAEVVTGREFGALLRERLFEPVEARTAVFFPAAAEELQRQIPTRYERAGGRLEPHVAAPQGEELIAFPSPGGGLVSTLDDVARVLLLHRNRGRVGGRTLVAAEVLQELYRPQPATGRTSYGLGFNVLRRDGDGVGDRLRHTGASGTFVLIDFRQDLLVVMLTQVPTRQTQPFGERLRMALDQVFSPQ